MTEFLLIAGQIGSGKTAAATEIASLSGGTLVRVRDALEAVLGGGEDWDRNRLQVEGAALDRRTNGRWLLDYLVEQGESCPRVIVDAIRTRRQVEPILETIVDCRMVYLSCTETVRRIRYARGQLDDPVKRGVAFDVAMAHDTELEAATVRSMAHAVIETSELSVHDVAALLRESFGWSANVL